MAQLNSKTYAVTTPDSDTNIAFEEYEYMLCWYNRAGSPVQWLFEDWDNKQRVRTSQTNIKDADKITNIVSSEIDTVTLTAEDITRDQRQLFNSIFVAKTIYRVYRIDSILYEAGGFEKVAILDGGINWIQSKQRFQIDLVIRKPEPTQWR
jgi:hypothetical protein